MKKRPILFSGPMVRAIPDGGKTQTRKVVKPQPPSHLDLSYQAENGPAIGLWSFTNRDGDSWRDYDDRPHMLNCPYGQPGDRLWVRETWAVMSPDRNTVWHKQTDPNLTPGMEVVYRADEDFGAGCWRPSIHMPRWASRTTLEVTDVRVERVQGVSEEDAKAEGLGACGEHAHYDGNGYRCHFAQCWNGFLGAAKRGFGWDVNPWVWVLNFRRISQW